MLQECRISGCKVEESGVDLFWKGLTAYDNKNYKLAREWWQQAAEFGDVRSNYNLGVLYFQGLGDTKKNYIRAANCWQIAAEGGYTAAFDDLGFLYNLGKGVVQDYHEAHRYWQQAAAHGSVTALYNLGNLHYKGQGVVQNYREARRYWQRAAAGGYAPAFNNIITLYRDGFGVAADIECANHWCYLLNLNSKNSGSSNSINNSNDKTDSNRNGKTDSKNSSEISRSDKVIRKSISSSNYNYNNRDNSLLANIAKSKNPKKISINSCKIDDAILFHICQTHQKDSLELAITDCNFNDTQVAQLLFFIKIFAVKVTKLDLSDNSIAAITTIAQLAAVVKSELILSGNSFANDVAVAAGAEGAVVCRLQLLDISRCQFSDENLEQLAQAIDFNRSQLTTVKLTESSIDNTAQVERCFKAAVIKLEIDGSRELSEEVDYSDNSPSPPQLTRYPSRALPYKKLRLGIARVWHEGSDTLLGVSRVNDSRTISSTINSNSDSNSNNSNSSISSCASCNRHSRSSVVGFWKNSGGGANRATATSTTTASNTPTNTATDVNLNI